MAPKRLAAVFYLPPDAERLWLPDLLRRAGATAVDAAAGAGAVLDCVWAGLHCRASLHARPGYSVLRVEFWQSDFLELGGVPPGEHPVALAFRAACRGLSPEAAYIAAHLDQATVAFADSLEPLVVTCAADVLADRRLGLLYLGPDLAAHWTATPTRDDRDSLPAEPGRLEFAGRGPTRWF